MSTVFADTFYFLGLLNRADEAHGRCKQFAAEFRGDLLSTDYVLLEVADGLAAPHHRVRTARFVRQLRAASLVTIIPASKPSFASPRPVRGSVRQGVVAYGLHVIHGDAGARVD